LPAAPRKRCDEANRLLAFSVELATLIHHGGGSVSFENKADLIDRAGLDLIEAWFEQNLQWMISLVSPDQPKADRPATLVIGQEHFHAHRRGIVWDCRREDEGIIVPLDFTANTGSNWNVEWLREQLQSHPCRETVSHLCDGADYKVSALPRPATL
jgi:hypothetical protein